MLIELDVNEINELDTVSGGLTLSPYAACVITSTYVGGLVGAAGGLYVGGLQGMVTGGLGGMAVGAVGGAYYCWNRNYPA